MAVLPQFGAAGRNTLWTGFAMKGTNGRPARASVGMRSSVPPDAKGLPPKDRRPFECSVAMKGTNGPHGNGRPFACSMALALKGNQGWHRKAPNGLCKQRVGGARSRVTSARMASGSITSRAVATTARPGSTVLEGSGGSAPRARLEPPDGGGQDGSVGVLEGISGT